MQKLKLPDEVLRYFRETGAIGGRTRASKYSKEQLSEMGKKGGRPKKHGKQTERKGIQ